MIIEDEYGTPWFVEAGDPVRHAINTLRAAGYQYVVLPRTFLSTATTGTVGGCDGMRKLRMLDCLETLNETSDN